MDQQQRYTRRRFLGLSGAALVAVAAGACSGTGSTGTSASATGIPAGEPAGSVTFANWPQYIDRTKTDEGWRHVSLDRFTERTGIEVAYVEPITGYSTFFGKLLPSLEAGQPTGYDVVLMAGRELAIMGERGWLTSLQDADSPNFEANAAPWVARRVQDPEGLFTRPWQGGITGIAVDTAAAPGSVESLADLADPSKVGTASVGMIADEMPDFVMAQLGIDVATSGPAEWQEAADWLRMQRDSGTVRSYYTISYTDDLDAKNLVASMAWSGDILLRSIWLDRPELRFITPDGHGLLWSDEMIIPAGAEHPIDAAMLMDHFYSPAIAKLLTEWVLFLSPVDGVRELILDDAAAARDEGDPETASLLEATAEDPFTFPDDATLAGLQGYRVLTNQDEFDEWSAIFNPIIEGN